MEPRITAAPLHCFGGLTPSAEVMGEDLQTEELCNPAPEGPEC